MKVYVLRESLCFKFKLIKHIYKNISGFFSPKRERLGSRVSPYAACQKTQKSLTRLFFRLSAPFFRLFSVINNQSANKQVYPCADMDGSVPAKNQKNASLKAEKSYIWLCQQALTRLYTLQKRIHNNILKPNAIALKLWALSFSLAIVLFCVCLVHAGQPVGLRAAQRVAFTADSIIPIKLCEKLPDIFWSKQHLIYRNGDTIRQSFQQYQEKLLILDFWATWCTSCLLHFPDVQQLADSLPDELNIVLVNTLKTRDRYANIQRSFNKHQQGLLKNFSLPSVIHDSYLDKLFPHYAVPHYVWINERGYVVATTFSSFVTAEQVQHLLDEAKRVRNLNQ